MEEKKYSLSVFLDDLPEKLDQLPFKTVLRLESPDNPDEFYLFLKSIKFDECCYSVICLESLPKLGFGSYGAEPFFEFIERNNYRVKFPSEWKDVTCE